MRMPPSFVAELTLRSSDCSQLSGGTTAITCISGGQHDMVNTSVTPNKCN